VHDAGGAVGTALLQLGKLFDLKMYGTASMHKLGLVKQLGATPIDYRREDFVECIRILTGDGVDFVFDPIGGDYFSRSQSVLRIGGVLVAYDFYNNVMGRGGSIPLDLIQLHVWNIWSSNHSAKFFSIGALRRKQPQWFSEDLSRLFDLLVQKKFKPIIGAQMSLAEARQAHELIEQANVLGKIVLTVN